MHAMGKNIVFERGSKGTDVFYTENDTQKGTLLSQISGAQCYRQIQCRLHVS